jgi:RHS repeat-associated protein
LNRLSTATATNWNMQWSYDEFGNRLTQTGSSGVPTTSMTYDPATNHIVGASYDAAGNLTSMSGQYSMPNVGYDVFDHATSITPTVNGHYPTTTAYDAFGRRIAVTPSSGSPKIYFYSASGQLLSEFTYTQNQDGTSSSPVTASYQYFAGQRVGFRTDRTGSKRADSSSTGHYYPYGEEITGTSNDTYKFAQTYRDSDSGLDYASARFYASGIGRFLNPDPSNGSGHPGDPKSWNRYAYTRGDPVNRTDRSGLEDEGDDWPDGGCWSSYAGGWLRDGDRGFPYWCDFYQSGGGGAPQPKGPGGPGGTPTPNETLLSNAVQHEKDVMTDKCAQAIGASNAADAVSQFSKVLMGFSDLGTITTTTDASGTITAVSPNPPIAQFNAGAISFNTQVNWNDPNLTSAINQNGQGVIYHALDAMAFNVGAASMTATQFMDFTLLHELAHSLGGQHPPNDATDFNKNIWSNCFP